MSDKPDKVCVFCKGSGQITCVTKTSVYDPSKNEFKLVLSQSTKTCVTCSGSGFTK